jgi:hypothetical protein
MKKIVYLLALVLLISTVLWSATPAAKANQGNKQTVPVVKKINPRPVLENGVTPKHISKFNAAPIDGYMPESKAARGGVEVVWEEDFEPEEDLYYYVGLSYIWDSPGEFTKYAVRYSSYHGSILEGAYFYFYNGASTNVDVTVLSDNSGYPGSVLGSVSYTPTVGGWNYVDLSSLSLTFTGGQDFYISFESTVDNVTIISDDGSGTANRSLVWTGTAWEYAYENAYCGGPYEWAMDAILTYTESWTSTMGQWQYLEDSPTAKDTVSHSATHCWWMDEGINNYDTITSPTFYLGGDHNIYLFSLWANIEFPRSEANGNPGSLDEYYDVYIADVDNPLLNEWHIDTYNAYSGNSWWCGKDAGTWVGYGNSWTQYVETPSLDFSSAGATITLDFMQRSDSEPGYDFCTIYATNDDWNSLTQLAQYDDAHNTWYSTQIDLSAFSGDANVIIRYEFTSDTGYSDADGLYVSEGAWFLDDVVISDGVTTFFQDNADDQVNFIAPTLTNWAELFYEYDRDYPAPSNGWEIVDKDVIFNGTCDITSYKGKNIKFKIIADTDDGTADPGVEGAGLFIDDLAITGIDLPEIDMQCDRVVVPYPQTEGLANPKPWIIYHQAGYGSSGASGYCDVEGLGNAYPLFDFAIANTPALAMQEYGAYELTTQLPAYTATAGNYNFQGWNTYAFEGRADSFAPELIVEIYPPGEYELGYNSRNIGGYYYPGCTGAVTYYSPWTDGIFSGSETLKGVNHMIYNRGLDYGTDALLTFEVYEAATESTLGSLIYTEDIWFTIDPTERFAWLQIPFAQEVELTGDFFIYISGPFDNGVPVDHVAGNFDYYMLVDTEELFEDQLGSNIYAGHSFNYNAGTLEEYPSNFYVNALFNVEYQYDAPTNVQVTVTPGAFSAAVQITWDAPRFANASTTYTIYSDTDPNGTFSTVAQANVVGTTWNGSAVLSTPKKFYRVVTD